ncbi:MAG: DUF2723 domain-containing protein [Bacteroidales bacterium]|nr:DUF2723 domain-containing protein [Bacteroidales bacterium]
MRRHLQQSRSELVVGWLVALAATAVYCFTADRSVSWWDCGEFITISQRLWVGHPPGAPLYQLLAHLCTLLAPSPTTVARCCNWLSAIAAGLTTMVLYRSIIDLWRLGHSATTATARHLSAAVGAMSYAFCHTAWFSAVESEVYGLAMLFCSLTVWIMLRWRIVPDRRRLLLTALLVGLGLCVHLMTLLALPAAIVIYFSAPRQQRRQQCITVAMMLLLFVVGLTPYATIPVMARTNPPINSMGGSSATDFAHYLRRDQYEKAPLYPRLWRERDSAAAAEWSGGGNTLWANLRYYVTYQLGYMYGRYLLENFGGRLREGDNRPVLYIVPLLLATIGLLETCRRRNLSTNLLLLALPATLLLFGGPLLNFYLNHPCYEPRERDYAYVLSFYAIGFWIAEASAILLGLAERQRPKLQPTVMALLAAVPLWMCIANWHDHDRHNNFATHDIALNHLQSCDDNALLFTFGDNDTFPLWELHYVEGVRPDITIANINLIGFARFLNTLSSNSFDRPVYLSHYAYERLEPYFHGRLQAEGYCWRLMPTPCPEVNAEAFERHARNGFVWHDYSHQYLDPVSLSFLDIFAQNRALLPPQSQAVVAMPQTH